MTVLDTSYILPLAKIGIDTDVLLAMAEKRSTLRFDKVTVSLISLFELQAKAAKLRVPAQAVNDSVEAILDNFEVFLSQTPRW